MADHLSRHHTTSSGEISDIFTDEQLLTIVTKVPWIVHIVNYLVTKSVPECWNTHQKIKFSYDFDIIFGENLNCSMSGLIRLFGNAFRGVGAYSIDLSLIFMWRLFYVEKDWSKGATKWLLLANSIQECDQVLQGIYQVRIRIKNLKAR